MRYHVYIKNKHQALAVFTYAVSIGVKEIDFVGDITHLQDLEQVAELYAKEYRYIILNVDEKHITGHNVSPYMSNEMNFDNFFNLTIEPPNPLRKVEFVYHKSDGSDPSWRTLEVHEESPTYLKGFENGDFKQFLKSRIVDGRIIELKK